MRKALTLMLLLLACGCSLQAQEMVGFRQGVSLWMSRYGIGQGTLQLAQGQHFTWDKELFFRGNLEKKWWYEAGIANYRFRNTGSDRNHSMLSEQNDIIETNFSLQYDVTNPLIGYMFKGMEQMKSYIGFNVSPAISFNKYQTEDVDGKRTDRRDRHMSVMIGFSYTHVIPITSRLNIVSRFSFETNSFSKYRSLVGFSRPNKSIGWQTGIAYSL